MATSQPPPPFKAHVRTEELADGYWTGEVWCWLPGETRKDSVYLFGVLDDSEAEVRSACEKWMSDWKHKVALLIERHRRCAERLRYPSPEVPSRDLPPAARPGDSVAHAPARGVDPGRDRGGAHGAVPGGVHRGRVRPPS